MKWSNLKNIANELEHFEDLKTEKMRDKIK